MEAGHAQTGDMQEPDGPPVVNEEDISLSLEEKAVQEWAEVERNQNGMILVKGAFDFSVV